MSNNKEIEINKLLSNFWQQKWLFIGIISVFAVASVVYAITQPNVYKAEVTLAPSSNDSQAQGLGGQLGGLAALTGMSLGQDTSKVNLAMEVLMSRKFLTEFIHEYNVTVPLFAMEKWDPTSMTEVLDPEIYDPAAKKWVREMPDGKSPVPTDWETYKLFKDSIANEATAKGFIKISVESKSPRLAEEWANGIVTNLNAWIKQQDIQESQQNIKYLQKQLETTSVSEMQKVFYQLIEEQTKKLMLAEAQQEYVFKVIDPAVFPEEKDSPRRALICILGTFLGGVFAFFICLVRAILRSGEK